MATREAVPASVVATRPRLRDHAVRGVAWALAGERPASVVLYLGVLGLLVGGPKPWRATWWAWFWLLGSVPVLGALAFLLLGGSTSVLPPSRPERRLTGGWAFLLAGVIAAAAGSVAAALF